MAGGIDYINNPGLHPKILLAEAIYRGYDVPIATQILPEQLSVEDLILHYYDYTDTVFESPKLAPPGTTAPTSAGYFAMHQVEAKPYRLGAVLDDWTTNQSWHKGNAYANTITSLYNQFMLQQEYDVMYALSDTSTFTSIGNSTKTSNYWDDNVNGDPIKDVLNAIKTIRETAKAIPNSFIITSEIHATLMSRPDVQRLMFQGNQNSQVANGVMTNFLGLDVFVNNTITKTTGTWAESTTFLNDEKAFILERGDMLGITHVAEPMQFNTWREDASRGVHVELLKTFAPTIWRQTRDYFYATVMST